MMTNMNPVSDRPLLETRGLKKFFKVRGGLLHAVDNVSITIPARTTLGVVGESGCGKSTLGRAVLRLIEPTAGQVLFNGEDITKFSRYEMREMRRQMQIIFQDPYSSINPRMSVAEIIAEYMLINHTCSSKAEAFQRTAELMDVVGLARRYASVYPHELDGGRRQRIGIARALAVDPEFIVCDEPVSALDVSIQAQVLNLMMDLQEQRNLTYIFITHNLSVVKHISNDIMVMYLGPAVEKADSKELFKHQYHPYTKALISAIPRVDIDNKSERILIRGEITSPIEPPNACRFAPRCEYATERCHQEFPQLEEVEPGHFVACHRVRELNDL